MVQQPAGIAWWRSLYLRIGVSFVLLVIAIALIQGLLFTARMQRDARDPRRSPHAVAMEAALAAAAAMERSEPFDLRRMQQARFPDWALMDIVMSDGTVQSTSSGSPLPPAVLDYARQMLSPTPPEERVATAVDRPLVTAPIQVDGQLKGVVLLRFPRRSLISEVARFLSISGLLVLAASTALASWIIFTPARRKLSALEAAAERMREGDLKARAPEDGGDEIALVARAFNRMGDQLVERDETLRTVDLMRRQMLADVSHELKTPLTAMRGFIETLQMPQIAADEERRTRYFATLERETRRLERIVADLLDVARLENNAADFELRVFSTRRLFEQVARRNERVAVDNGVAFDIQVADEADQVYADPHRLEQAVDNLVANALRYTPSGGRVSMRADMAGETVALKVVDTGPGIPAEHIGHVFDRFYKADPSRAATREGSGLGLSIVRAIVERHGGTVGVTSEPGNTEFTLLLPAEGTTEA
ncbi:Alkaline phosphatase synthesis sensor protein PhoR [Luteitalea pratensis]|uniref:histidine kinase n=1 Tax=Luteitalea pratensis TaxID=1855912 RepID=A0A143PM88_LUTPR|nr:HAMP domain-containing sensor histidine kinase [Luteitalea pratensis]AMY09715.1 Alkaline phosphatase synthesis sensor protein PhoR [Luteitalea pratensis]